MVLNLQVVLLGCGILVVLIVYLLSAPQNRRAIPDQPARSREHDSWDEFPDEDVEQPEHAYRANTADIHPPTENLAQPEPYAEPDLSAEHGFSTEQNPSAEQNAVASTIDTEEFYENGDEDENGDEYENEGEGESGDGDGETETPDYSHESHESLGEEPLGEEPFDDESLEDDSPSPAQRPDEIVIEPFKDSQSMEDSRTPVFTRTPISDLEFQHPSNTATDIEADTEPDSSYAHDDPLLEEQSPDESSPSGWSLSSLQQHKVEGFGRLSQIDYWVKITGQRDVGRETVLAIYRDGSMDLTKTHSIHGLKVDSNEWCDLQHETEDSRFADLVLSIQLADRDGAVSESEMTRFSALVARLSECTGREFLFMTTIENALVQATAVAEFIKYFDSVCAINVRADDEQPLTGTVIDRQATQIGMEKTGDYYSRFESINKNKEVLYHLANTSDTGKFDFEAIQSFHTKSVTFFIKPAVSRVPVKAFAEMVDTARSFASRIKGVTNWHGHDGLYEEEVKAMRESIEQNTEQMKRLGIAAGSDIASRLF